jgi:hypothetical protein
MNKDNETIISYNSVLECVDIRWQGIISDEIYKHILNKGYEIIIEKKCIRWLSIMKDAKLITDMSYQWFKSVFFPKLASHGIKKIAIVFHPDELKKYHAEIIATVAENLGIESKYFDSVEEGENWIARKE